ncbi:hypothetical protein HAHE_12820 [Haloferula helveola]|uniref:Holin-X, holin superfamily III n=1 Tax=Haloferula helveola TaxID=490095 RepID=A0ABN6H1C3_9BACT|nr:hypothetical protein HAHE_12820 [Haloferula helveola]
MSEAPETYRDEAEGADGDWKASAAEFVQARIELIRLEARDAGREAARKAATVVIITGCAILCWMLVITGLIGLVAAARPDWPWYHITLVAAGLHLAIAGIGVLSLRKGGQPPFPLTRSEFAKDQAWLETLKKKR